MSAITRICRSPLAWLSAAAVVALIGLLTTVVVSTTADHQAAAGGRAPAASPAVSLALQKAAIAAAMQARRLHAPRPKHVTPLVLAPDAPRRSRIITTAQNPLGQGFHSLTTWTGPSPKPSQWYVVYTGSLLTSGGRTSPAVAVYAEPADPNAADQYFVKVGVYTDPSAAGPLRVESANSSGLVLSSTSDNVRPSNAGAGARSTFSLTARAFLR